ncbi:MAG: arsenic efflux protein [Acidobacteria bacterium]|nr:arsenic efflux protein [Acidobacteriota bacterium]
MQLILSALNHALLITGFVAIIMLVIEYLNVVSQGAWQERLSRHLFGQYLLATFLGVTPGCLGAFAVVTMYTHRRMTLGSVVAAMIATSGDESFVMFAMIPKTAILLHALLFVIGLIAGFLTDRLAGAQLTRFLSCSEDFTLHQQDYCRCFAVDQFAAQWKKCSAARGTLTFSLLAFLVLVAAGQIGPEHWNWVRTTLLLTSCAGLFIVVTVPEHFLEEHLWKHVIRQHVPRVFLWTAGALLLMELITKQWQIGDVIQNNNWVVLILAAMVGLIPESGPHLIFVTLSAQNLVPLSTLLTSSIVQDGHGMLPMLAHSRRAFFLIKFIALGVGLVVGLALMALGY